MYTFLSTKCIHVLGLFVVILWLGLHEMDTKTYISQRRKELRLSLADLATLMSQQGYNVERQTISHWEHGRNQPPLHDPIFRQALAIALQVNQNDLAQMVGLIVPNSERSKEAMYGAELIDSMADKDRKKAIKILESLVGIE